MSGTLNYLGKISLSKEGKPSCQEGTVNLALSSTSCDTSGLEFGEGVTPRS